MKIIDVDIFFYLIKIYYPVHFLPKWRQNLSIRPRTLILVALLFYKIQTYFRKYDLKSYFRAITRRNAAEHADFCRMRFLLLLLLYQEDLILNFLMTVMFKKCLYIEGYGVPLLNDFSIHVTHFQHIYSLFH